MNSSPIILLQKLYCNKICVVGTILHTGDSPTVAISYVSSNVAPTLPAGHTGIVFKYGCTSASSGVSVLPARFSIAHCCFPDSICRRLFKQPFFCACVRERIMLGIEIVANIPTTATTIIISTRVKPDLRTFIAFIIRLPFRDEIPNHSSRFNSYKKTRGEGLGFLEVRAV